VLYPEISYETTHSWNSNPQYIEVWNRFAQFFKIDRIHYFDIRHSLFDIRYSLFHFAESHESIELFSNLAPPATYYAYQRINSIIFNIHYKLRSNHLTAKCITAMPLVSLRWLTSEKPMSFRISVNSSGMGHMRMVSGRWV
jgi:hypothetical protein